MNAQTPIEIAAAAEPSDPRIERQLEMLGRLAEVGLNIAIALERQATGADDAEAEPVTRGDIPLAYARVSRAVRQTLALQSRLIADLKDRAAAAAGAAGRIADEQRDERKDRAFRVIRRVFEADPSFDDEAEDDDAFKERVEQFVNETEERLDDEDQYGDILARPISETVAAICRDLDLTPDWTALALEPWAQEEMRSGDVGEPLKRPPPLAGGSTARIRADRTAQKVGGGMPAQNADDSPPQDPEGSVMPPQSLRDSSPASGGARESSA